MLGSTVTTNIYEMHAMLTKCFLERKRHQEKKKNGEERYFAFYADDTVYFFLNKYQKIAVSD